MRKQADGKVRRSREEWERIFDRFYSSTMTGTAYCRREKIAKSSFEKWRKKIELIVAVNGDRWLIELIGWARGEVRKAGSSSTGCARF